MIKVHIKKEYPGFSLKVDFESDIKNIALLGSSGCGKSLTLKCIAGIIKPDEGFISIDDKVVFDSEKHINLPPQKREVGYLFQSYALFPNMTVKKNILTGLHKEENKEEKNKKIEFYSKLLHIEEILPNYPHEISGGQAQRVALARILASKPKILLLDEPFSALDSFLRNKLQMEMKEILNNFEGQSIMVTHDRDEAYLLDKEIVLIDNGQVIIQKETKELFDDPEYYKAAVLSGCKNFSKAYKNGEKDVVATDWGITLHMNKSVPDDIQYIGIRAHNFSLEKKDISFKINVHDITEETFNNLVRFRFEYQNSGSDFIYWKIEKNVPLTKDINEANFSYKDILLLK